MNTIVHLSELLEGVLITVCDAINVVQKENGLHIASMSVETCFHMEKRTDAEGGPQLYVNPASKSFSRGATRNLTRNFGSIKIGVSSKPRF